MGLLAISLIVSVGINIVMFVPAYLFKTDKLTDISYALTFVAVAIYGLLSGGLSAPNLILSILVLFWAARLGTYLLVRIRKIGSDKRFDEMRKSFWKFGRFWLLQGITVWVVLLPSILFFQLETAGISIFMWVGILIWFVGLLIEAIADVQKFKFINNPKNKGKWIDTGLWKHSRHPNYFGEILLWVGVYVFTLGGLTGALALVGLIGPVYIALLIMFVSGIPLLEKAGDRRWGEDPRYSEYKSRTSVLVPLPQKGGL